MLQTFLIEDLQRHFILFCGHFASPRTFETVAFLGSLGRFHPTAPAPKLHLATQALEGAPLSLAVTPEEGCASRVQGEASKMLDN